MFTESLAGKTIVVTGAASGIGKRTSELLRTADAQVIALDRKEVTQFVQADLADPSSIDAAVVRLAADHPSQSGDASQQPLG